MKCLRTQNPTGQFLFIFVDHERIFWGRYPAIQRHNTRALQKPVSEDKISDLTAHINFNIKTFHPCHYLRQDKAIKTSNETVKDIYEFFNKLSDEDDFEHEIVEDILKDKPYEHKKVE